MFYDFNLLEACESASPAPQDALQAIAGLIAQNGAPKTKPSHTIPKLAKGIWFDAALDLRNPEGDALTQHILERIAPFEKLKNTRSKLNAAKHYQRVHKTIANALFCFSKFDPALTAYNRCGGRVQGQPEWYTGTGMRDLTDAFEAAGLLVVRKGRPGWDFEPGIAPSFSATEALLFGALDFGVTEHSITYHLPLERLVRRYKTNCEGPQEEFEHTEETRRWTEQVAAFNAFLDKQDIGLSLTFDEEQRVAARLNDKRPTDLPRFHTPDWTRRHLYRQFNNGSFETGGRLYGGWWINIPKDLRQRIRINGSSTVELDYSGCAIRMIYHERGLECPYDPYFLDEIATLETKKGLPADYYREGIKALTQARINGSNREDDMMCDLPNGISFSPHFTREQVTAMIEAKHAAIAEAFGSGVGIRLQRKDSDLALSITTSLMEKGIVALPIHDSFIVESTYKDQLFEEMNVQYNSLFGYGPVIKE